MIKRRVGFTIFLLASVATASVATGATSAPYDSLLIVDFNIRLDSGQQRIVLPWAFLRAGSELVKLDGRMLLPLEDYLLDAEGGVLELREPGTGGHLHLRVLRRAFPLPRLLTGQPLRSWSDLAARDPIAETDAAPRFPGSKAVAPDQDSFTIGGTKSIVLRLGDGEDLSLEQSLRLHLEGQLSENTRLEASLRDDDLPFQPEGNTERLEELDKVYLRLSGPQGRAQVGDFVFESAVDGPFGIERDFQGLEGLWRLGDNSLSAFLARSRGIPEAVDFFGEEGLQGPYELLSALRADGAVVLAGSEEVQLNGETLRRGRDLDYTIDYDRGSVSFSNKRPIRASDRIRVEFRYSLEAWQRTALGGEATATLGNLTLGFSHFEEGDDERFPLAFSLDSLRQAALAAAGDGEAINSHVAYNPGGGSYLLEEDPESGETWYAWADSLGDWSPSFREVGQGLGDYRFVGVSAIGERIFEYAGAGGGAFALGEKLQPPRSYRLDQVELNWRGEKVRAGGDIALSALDRNLVSTADDDDNLGLALRSEVELDLGDHSGLQLRYNRRDANFVFPGPQPGDQLYRDWNLPDRPDSLSEQSGLLTFHHGDLLRLGIQALRLAPRFTGLRGSCDFSGGWRRLQVTAHGSRQGSRDQKRGEGSKELGRLRLELSGLLSPSLQYTADASGLAIPDSLDSQLTPELRSNYSRERWQMDLAAPLAGGRWTLSSEQATIRAGSDRDESTALSSRLAGGGSSNLQLGLSGQYRRRRGFVSNDLFLAEGHLDWRQDEGPWRGRALYRLGSQMQRLRLSTLIHVGYGLGDLNEDGVFVGEGLGEYRRRSILAEETARTRDLELELAIGREERKGSAFERLGLETSLILREQTRSDRTWELALLRPERFQEQGQTLYGQIDLSQELRWRPKDSPWSTRYRYQYLDAMDERNLGADRQLAEQSHILRLRRRGEDADLILRLYGETQWRHSRQGGQGGSYDVLRKGLESKWTRRFSARMSTTLRLAWQGQRDADRALALDEVILEPRLSVSPVALLRLSGSWQWSRTQYREGDPEIGRPWFFDPPGWNGLLRLEASAQPGSNLTLTALYEVRDERGLPRRQRFRLESRAFF